ncbi:hypothetical protein [Marinoscillum furvescens]|uniref:Uncharacterized protein n=1 Tax=Marinoscillum furvescens DSM 4134 TaxID=1122208 RepID=A0A3D9L1A0_MARFU|nr:hypothetical protein [Marinoscillum furvescens]RED95598.1 hypothetical protein C7460_11747 [Marinoscillum furvescens DSM 4134]
MRIPNYLKRGLIIVFVLFAFYFSRQYIIHLIVTFYEDYSIDGLISEVIGGITTSVIIFIFYIILTPIIEISPKILRYDDGKYRLKIYNSSLFAAYEVRAIFTKVTPIKANNGKRNVEVNDIPTTIAYLEYLPSMYNLESRKNGNTFAIVYTIEEGEDIFSVLSDKKDSSYYRLTISCKNGFTGLRKIKTENYTYKTSVIDKKEFASGATFKRI